MFKDKTIVYTSGTFDMFHYNHLRMINYARSLADILIVGVSTDELVSSYKAKPNYTVQRTSSDHRSVEDSGYCHTATYAGSYGNSKEAEYRCFCCGR